ncbi:uncharacterized protein DC041_0004313 [Schistosoma bovis]|uniref:Galectin domain-containing protein n=1 Tax=Schistosoma bovis TaxID=6184 RepID=A0A430QRU1_SCHBO|nr:uncharacterized protein DC041_0004313 [Schistosoma bovis]
MDESFDDQDTEFTYEIPDCLMDGDYIEIHGVCHGKRIVFELLTEEASTQNIFDKLPLQIILTTDGLVTVISRNPEKVAKQERSVENGIQIDKAFELCVHAYKKCYVVKLNGEDVCGQDHLVPLNEAFALSMQGKVDILSLEFKDMYYDEEEMNNNTNMSSANNNSNSIRMDDAQAGFVRVNELRQSSIRRNDPPVMVPTRTNSKLEKQSIKRELPEIPRIEQIFFVSKDELSPVYINRRDTVFTKVKLNGEDVCGQDHLVPLNEAFALSMQGKVDILSLEFKDMYYDEEEMNNNTNMSSANNNSNSIRMDDAQAGFVRVNELRQSSIRRNDPPVMVPTRTNSKLEKQSIKSKDSNLEVTAWKTSNDLSRAYLDVDYKVSTLDRNSAAHSYRNSIDFSHNSDTRISGTLPPLGKSANDRVSDYVMGSRGNLNTNDASHIKPKTSIFGSRKSATLSNSKIEQRFNEGRSQTDAGDLHHGSYSVLDDEDHIGSQLSATTSTPNLQDKHKKKRFSLLGKNRKSTGSESDVRNDSKKSKGSTPDISLKDGEGEKKKKGLHLKNPFKRSKTKGTVKLNGEDVCGQDHLVPLNEAFALSMQGKVDILSLEFKDMYYDEEEMNNNTNMSSANNNSNSIRMDDAQAGFVRVNELRQSSIRRNDPPVMVPTRTGSKLEKQSIKSKDSNLEVTAWKTSNDLSRAYLDVDYKVSTLDRNSAAHSYRNSIDFSHNSDSRISGTLPPLGKSANDRVSDYVMGSRGNLNTNDASHIKPKTSIFGSRKSATLSNSKIEQRFNEGRSQTDAGDLHHGSYSVLDDEDHIGSQLSATTSTPNLQDKHKKKRFSLLGKNRKSTGSESDVRNDSKKSKGSTPDIRLKDGEGEKKKKGLHLKNPFKRSKTKDQTPSVSSDLAFTRNTIHPAINVAVTERLPKEMSKKPAPEIAAYLHKSNPSAEFDTLNLTGREILSEDTHFAPFDKKHYDGYENVGSSYDPFKHKTLSDSRKSIEISSLSDLHSQGKLKGPAPELAALIHSKHPTSNPEDITIAQGSGSHIRPFTPTDHSPKQSRYHNEPPSDIANLKLKGTAPEIAAIINSRTKSPNHEDITLTQRCDPNFHPYPTVDTSGKKPFKPSGSASEIAADIHKNNLADHRPYADYTLTGTNTNEIQGTKYVLKEKVQSTRKALSLSEHISDGDETESGGSEVYTDNECYLEVGKSEYYFDRKRSLRNYRSKRSTKLEREARRNMGLHRNDSQESVSSSISSLKPTDRKLTPKYRKRPGTKKEEVSSWLNSSNSRKESIKCDSSMDLPHPLTTGRSAFVYGHFKYNSAARQSCLIKLEFNTCEEANECETLYLQLWSDGALDILNSQFINSKILYSSSNDIQYLTLKNNEFCNNDKQQVNFTLKFISQSFYTAITSNDLFTLILNNQFLKSTNYHLKSFKLEDSTNAELDKLFMPRNLCLPLILHMKDESSQTNTLNLLTKLTADTKSSEFVSMQILLNFETGNLIIQEIAKETNNIQYAEKEITYIPEQICKMKFSWYNNTLKVLLNSDESMMYNFEQYYPLQFLSHIRINGDFMLLNAELQSDE